jgi:hypothetical protein
VQSPGNYLSAEAQQGSTAGSNGGGFFVDLAELPLEFRDLIPMRLGKSSSGVNPAGSVDVVAGRQQLHFFWAEQNI